ncbi:hypothetical protein HAX54_028012 [Datura stramonium]|uniref:Uncharacterized protein n=1 Tax=Datura stramonium TaxID=4076 RepID=A0ABS8V498_DATST|nr:hypothetical protein [Datura stramonium]
MPYQGAEFDEEKRIDQLHFGLNKMKNYFVQFKEKCSINANRLDLRLTPSRMASRIFMINSKLDWDPFTIPLKPYFLELYGPISSHHRMKSTPFIGRPNASKSRLQKENGRQNDQLDALLWVNHIEL